MRLTRKFWNLHIRALKVSIPISMKSVFWIGSGRYVPKKFPHWFQRWNNRRIKLKVKWRNLLRYELKQEVKAMPYEFVKFLPEEFSGNPTVIGIYGNKVVNFLLENYNDARLERINLNIKRSKAVIENNGKKLSKEVEKCLRIWPQDNDTSGFFVAKIKKL